MRYFFLLITTLLLFPNFCVLSFGEENQISGTDGTINLSPSIQTGDNVNNTPTGDDSGSDTDTEIVEEVEIIKVDPGTSEENFLQPERAFALAYPETTKKGRMLFILDHRAANPDNLTSPQDLYGLDNGSLKIGLSLRYGVLDNLDFGISRLNGTGKEIFDTYNFDAKYVLFSEKTYYSDLLVSAVYTWFNQEGVEDSSGFGGQLISGKTILDKFYFTLGMGFHSNSSSFVKETFDKNYSFFLPATLKFKIQPWMALIGECSVPYLGYSANNPAWAAGFKFLTFGHSFSLLISNTQYLSFDGEAAGSDRWGKPIFAFALTREFTL